MRLVTISFGFILFIFPFIGSAPTAAISKTEAMPIIELLKAEKYDSALVRIQALETIHKDDPEIFVFWANYYYVRSYQSVVVLSKNDSNGSILTLYDSSGQPAGFASDSIVFYEDSLRMAISVLQEAIRKHPNRMDFHVSLMQITQESRFYPEMTAAILHVLELTKKQLNWESSFSVPLQANPAEDFLEGIQYSASVLFSDTSAVNDSLFLVIANALVATFPYSVYGYTDLGIMAMAHKQYKEAMTHLLNAYTIDSTDVIILSDLALVSTFLADTAKAKEWYGKILTVGTDEEKAYARSKIQEFEKK